MLHILNNLVDKLVQNPVSAVLGQTLPLSGPEYYTLRRQRPVYSGTSLERVVSEFLYFHVIYTIAGIYEGL